MIILGLHFGHDGTACVIEDGRIRSNVLRERICRRKHALGIDDDVIRIALSRAGCTAADVDAVAVTSTQTYDLVLEAAPSLTLRYGSLRRAPLVPSFARPGILPPPPADMLGKLLCADFAERVHPMERALLADYSGRPGIRGLGVWRRFPGESLWHYPSSAILEPASDLRSSLGDCRRTHGFHVPMEAELDGQVIPGVFIHHHVAHAASSFFRSPFDEAAVFTQDGHGNGIGSDCGAFFWGSRNALVPLAPHHTALGFFYDEVGRCLNLGALGGPGKLMGLAPYGRARFTNPGFVGEERNRSDMPASGDFIADAIRRLVENGEDLGALGKASRMTDPVNADIAASAQAILERSRVEAVRSLRSLCDAFGLPRRTLCLSGGVALNCPSNTLILAQAGFERVFAEPNCDDGGLAAGAGLYLYHHLLDRSRTVFDGPALPPAAGSSAHPFQGGSVIDAEAAQRGLEASGDLLVRPVGDPAAAAAREISAGRIVAWVQGPSEAGPRALGRRSILADPRAVDTWPRVNASKRREAWRPFAPAVLAEQAHEWFEGPALPSPYMLFVSRVTSDRLPAVTHVDGTARVQTVESEDLPFASLLRALATETGIPVVLNTSLNGPGEPIAETVEDVLRCLRTLDLDAAYVGPYRVTRGDGGLDDFAIE